MAGNLASPPPPGTVPSPDGNLFAAVDMGTNSFKLTVVHVNSSGRFVSLDCLKDRVQLGLDATTASVATTISTASLNRSISALRNFQNYLLSQRLDPSHLRLVATSAVREASNKSQFVDAVKDNLGFDVEILLGIEEARLIYLGVLQFFPLFSSTVLTIDIGGGSTEFAVGFEGNVLFAKSLRLGHLTLTQEFTDVMEMREHIRKELENSGLIEEIQKFKINSVVGSSGTVKAIDKAVRKGYARQVEENVRVSEEFFKRDGRFSKEELRCLVERLCLEEMETEGRARRRDFFERRAEYILAGTVLLDEVFKRLGIEEIEISEYALGEGVIAEMLGKVFTGFDQNANARWRSVVRLATKLNNKKRMKSASGCAGIAREIFEGLKKWNGLRDDGGVDDVLVSLDDRDLEHLEAACLLHNIGMYAGKKGYHEESYSVIENGNRLHGYDKEEIKLIALLVRYHKQKFPQTDALDGCSKEVKQKFRILCPIMRVAAAVQQCLPLNCQIMEFLHSSEGFNLVLRQGESRNQSPNDVQPLSWDVDASVENELENFRMVFKESLAITFRSSISSDGKLESLDHPTF